jgi:hypothetical protein
MARYDKYNPYGGGFRAPLAADWLPADVGAPIGVGLNNAGQVVKGAGQSGIVGVLILTMARKAGEIADVMKFGEIVEFGVTIATPAGIGAAGTAYFADATTGVINATSATGKTEVGHTVEGSRLIVAIAPSPVPA